MSAHFHGAGPAVAPGSGFTWLRDESSGLQESYFRRVLDELPAAIYTTDAAGRITYYNEAAVALWGHRPPLGDSTWCGSWKLYWPDGRVLPHDECPMALAVKERRAIRGVEAVAERPDGTKVPFIPYPTPIFAADGRLLGAVNMLVDISDRNQTAELRQHLAAIVEFSDDAIVGKDLNGIITSWNRGAERIFGHRSDEVVGQPITILIPAERHDEEEGILSRIRRGERIEHFETVRQRKDGSQLHVSLCVSPIKNARGDVVGASKIARNIDERRRVQEQQKLLLREMNHRIKNLFAVSSGLVSLSARGANSVEELATVMKERLIALSRAHALTLSSIDDMEHRERATTVHALVRAILSPFHREPGGGSRIAIRGDDIAVSGDVVTGFALLLHEFATNAAKHGALSTPEGAIEIECSRENDLYVLVWTERGGPPVGGATHDEGFGSRLVRATVEGQLGGRIVREWKSEGLVLRLCVPPDRLGATG
ncbi:MAG TPA: PAS domain S-box protein [Rhizomicrobium sp.]